MNRRIFMGSPATRRQFLQDISRSAGAAVLALNGISLLHSCNSSEEQSKGNKMATANKKKLGIALVGLGGYAAGQLAPALQQTKNCYLAGIVTGTSAKADKWRRRYDIPAGNIYDYQSFHRIIDNSEIDIVYVVLPNSMHEEYVVKAAKAGKHVICEKPMAITVDACDRMIAACRDAGKMLSIGYRLHFESYNLEMARLGREKIYGAVKKMSAGFGFPIGNPDQWRLKKEYAGGGPLMDVGIYCVQAFCYVSGREPLAVRAWEGPKTDPHTFAEVEQSLKWQFDFDGGLLAEGSCSYSDPQNYLIAEAEKGRFELTSAFNYSGQAGNTPEGPMGFASVNQQARQMDDFADAIRNNRPTSVPGEMGRRDVKYLAAIYEAMRTGRSIPLT